MPNRLSAGCCCQDCSCRQMLFDFRQDWHDVVEVVNFRTGTFTHGVAVVFDIASQTGFGVADNGQPRISGIVARLQVPPPQTFLSSFLTFLSFPLQVGFVADNDFQTPQTRAEFDELFDSRVNAGSLITTSGLPIPNASASRYVLLWKPQSSYLEPFGESSFTLFVLRQVSIPTFIAGGPFIDWRRELIRESEGQFRTKRPVPSLPVTVAQLPQFEPQGVISPRPDANRLTSRTSIELFLLDNDQEQEEEIVFDYRAKTMPAPQPLGEFEKFRIEWWNDSTGPYKTILHWLNQLIRNRGGFFTGNYQSEVIRIPEPKGGQWELSESEAGSVIHYHSIGFNANGQFTNQFSQFASSVGFTTAAIGFLPILSPDVFRIERDRIRVCSGVTNGEVIRFGALATDHFVDLEDADNLHLRVKSLAGRPIQALRLLSEVGQRGENTNCPGSQYNQFPRLKSRIGATSLKFDGFTYAPKCLIGGDPVGRMTIFRNSSQFGRAQTQTMTVFGSTVLEENTIVNFNIEFAWQNGQLVRTSELPTVPQGLRFAFCETAIRDLFDRDLTIDGWGDESLSQPPNPEQRSLVFGFRFYREVAGQWKYLGQSEIPSFLAKPTESEALIFASQLFQVEAPHDKFWFSHCDQVYTINVDAVIEKRTKAEFVRFYPEVELVVEINGFFVRPAQFQPTPQTFAQTFRTLGPTQPLPFVVNASPRINSVPESAPAVILTKMLYNFDPLNPPSVTLTSDNIVEASYLGSPLVSAAAESYSTRITTFQGNPVTALCELQATSRLVPLDSLEITLGQV